MSGRYDIRMASRRAQWWACIGCGLSFATGAPLHAQQATPAPPPLPAETSDVATLPPAGPHRAFVEAGFTGSGATVIDGASEDLEVLGLVPMNRGGRMTLSREADRIFVIETFYSRGNRGTREDVLAVYDGQTLNLTQEIILPGRLHVTPRPQIFEVSADARLAYVYDMVPASSVHVVDLEAGGVRTSASIPGCALVFPYGPRSFGTICGDGTIGAVHVPRSGEAEAVFSEPFFDPTTDPLFESSVIDKDTGEAWFLSYSGSFFPARLGDAPEVEEPWAITVAAGLPPSGTGVQELAWRPGGAGQVIALHRATKRLFVLMHTGNFWTHKVAGEEVWVFDAARRTLIRRIPLASPARSLAVSQDAEPLLFAVGEGGLSVLNAATGESLRNRSASGSLVWVPGH